MKFYVASIVTFVALFSQVFGASVQYCRGPQDLKCPDGLSCCGPLVDAVGICVPGPASVCKVPLPVEPVKKNCGGANEPKCN